MNLNFNRRKSLRDISSSKNCSFLLIYPNYIFPRLLEDAKNGKYADLCFVQKIIFSDLYIILFHVLANILSEGDGGFQKRLS